MLLPALAALSALIVAGMSRVGALDHPVERSSHTRPTPKGGGVGIVAAVAVGIAFGRQDMVVIVTTVAAVFLAAMSYLDDVRNWPFWLKLAAQCAAAAAVIRVGVAPYHLAVPGIGLVSLGWATPVLAFGWLLFTTNAVNFMDGLNGLAAGSVGVACLVLAIESDRGAAWPEWLVVAGVAGFLPFNYPAARIFMGDVGSQFLGFMVAALALRHASDPLMVAVLPLALSPMLLDVAFTLVRRWYQGERITQAHRSHLYQVAQRSGMRACLVSAVYWVMAAWGGLCGLAWGVEKVSLWPVAAMMPTLAWGVLVAAKAKRAGLKAW